MEINIDFDRLGSLKNNETFTKEEVLFILEEQKKFTAYSFGLWSFTLRYPEDYNKITEMIINSQNIIK